MAMTVTRGLRWGLVGALGLLVQLAALAALAGAGLTPALATSLAVALAIVHNYAWHERWTWGDRPARAPAERLRRIGLFGVLTSLASLVGTVAITTMLVERLHVPLLPANVMAVVAVSVVNFLSAHYLVFVSAAASSPGHVAVRHRTFVVVLTGAIVAGTLATPRTAAATELQRVTIDAWERYVRAVEVRVERESRDAASLGAGVDLSSLRRGVIDVRVARLDDDDTEAPGGLIHHWRGAVFVPGVTLDEVIAELQSVDGRRHLQEDVLAWRLVSGHPASARIFLKLVRREIVTVTYNTEHDVIYRRHSPMRASSRSVAVRIAELEDAGTTREREKRAGEDRGFLWRLNSYWRYEQVPGGVVIAMESVTLSRQVPALVRPLVRPLVDRIARESMVRTLDAVRRRFAAGAPAQAHGG